MLCSRWMTVKGVTPNQVSCNEFLIGLILMIFLVCILLDLVIIGVM